MKNKIITVTFASLTALFSACTGNHNSNSGKDTANNTYKTKDTSKVDTSKAASADHSSSGGVDAAKDTAKR